MRTEIFVQGVEQAYHWPSYSLSSKLATVSVRMSSYSGQDNAEDPGHRFARASSRIAFKNIVQCWRMLSQHWDECATGHERLAVLVVDNTLTLFSQ